MSTSIFKDEKENRAKKKNLSAVFLQNINFSLKKEVKILTIFLHLCVCERFFISEAGSFSFFGREKIINSAILLLTSTTNPQTKKNDVIVFPLN